ncbi:7544_t:CDS:2 [Paraglomus brasilianum]|uniref:7544_t:CDS:1 n=1 Tax=Paraglomus brasilianum TaxID=144538 RepID=A0A9N9BB04_9GLOM|nr:7544_t:CDS:2 [Paraglomus brasilianum]
MTEEPPQKRARTVTKSVLLQALQEFKDPSLCTYNSYGFKDRLINPKETKASVAYLEVGKQLPFTGRANELKELSYIVSGNMAVWKNLRCAETDTFELVVEIAKRTFQHPVVAGGPGHGKTTLMRLGIMKVMQDLYEKNWSHRAFEWDLNYSPLDSVEKILIRTPSGAESILALHILHRSFNGDVIYSDFIRDLQPHLLKQHLDYSDITIDAVLDHVLATMSLEPPDNEPIIVLFHISKTQKLLQTESYHELEALIEATFLFNVKMAQRKDGRYMLLTTFDGTYRAELLKAFERSGVRCRSIILNSVSLQTYIAILHGLAAMAKNSGIKCNSGLQQFTPAGPLNALISDCGDNVQLFSLLLYQIGCFENDERRFTWENFFANLWRMQMKLGLYMIPIESIRMGVINLVNTHYYFYTNDMQNLNCRQLLRVLIPALLNRDITDNITSKVLDSETTWECLEKEGVISLHGKTVELPFILVQVYLNQCKGYNDSIISFIHLLNELDRPSDFRQNEKCDLALTVLNLFHFHYNYPKLVTFTLANLFEGLEGAAANIELEFPSFITNYNIIGWPTVKSHQFNPEKDLHEGAYLGCGNDPYVDSWFVFRRSNCPVTDPGVVVLGIQSKCHKKQKTIKAEDVKVEKEKFRNCLPPGTPFVFMIVADMTSTLVAGDDEIIVTTSNMEKLYGPWLSLRRRFALGRFRV